MIEEHTQEVGVEQLGEPQRMLCGGVLDDLDHLRSVLMSDKNEEGTSENCEERVRLFQLGSEKDKRVHLLDELRGIDKSTAMAHIHPQMCQSNLCTQLRRKSSIIQVAIEEATDTVLRERNSNIGDDRIRRRYCPARRPCSQFLRVLRVSLKVTDDGRVHCTPQNAYVVRVDHEIDQSTLKERPTYERRVELLRRQQL